MSLWPDVTDDSSCSLLRDEPKRDPAAGPGWWGEAFFYHQTTPRALVRALRGVKGLSRRERAVHIMDVQPPWSPPPAAPEHAPGMNPLHFEPVRFGGATAHSGSCCRMRSSESLLRNRFNDTHVSTCEKECLRDSGCAFLSYNFWHEVCLLCSGCALTTAGPYVHFRSWRNRLDHVAEALASNAPSLIVIAALGALSPSYANVHSLLSTHFSDQVRWACTVYAYSPFGVPTASGVVNGGDEHDPNANAAKSIAHRCRIVECLGCSIGHMCAPSISKPVWHLSWGPCRSIPLTPPSCSGARVWTVGA